jgi:hypothetical protein
MDFAWRWGDPAATSEEPTLRRESAVTRAAMCFLEPQNFATRVSPMLARPLPLDLPRAFTKLDAIRQHVDIWWDSGAQGTPQAEPRGWPARADAIRELGLAGRSLRGRSAASNRY